MNETVPVEVRIERLKRLLFALEGESAYAILDGASVPDLLEKLAAAPEEHACLYRGELAPDLARTAPYLVKLRPESPLTEWILGEGWGHHWGVFALTPAGLEALRRHLRGFLRVRDFTGQVLYFRYYDPRVLGVYLPTCNAQELRFVFGPVSRFFCEDQGTAEPVVFAREGHRFQIVRPKSIGVIAPGP